MRASFVAPALIAASGLFAPAARPQSRGEIAATRSEAGRDETHKPAKVYTEDDLRAHHPSSGTFSQPSGAPGSAAVVATEDETPQACAPPAENAKTEDEKRAEKQAAWRKRLETAQAEISRLTEHVFRLQGLVDDLRNQIYGSGRTVKIQALEDAKARLAAVRQEAADLEEEGRRAGFR